MARILLLALCSLVSWSFAQDNTPPPGDYEEPHVTYVPEPAGIETPAPETVQRPAPQPATARTPPAEDRRPRLSLIDARTDWMVAVDLYVKQHSVDGVWTVNAAKGAAWRLKLIEARGGTVRERQPGIYAGIAAFKSVGGRPRRLDLEFLVDFNGGEPAVTNYVVKKIR